MQSAVNAVLSNPFTRPIFMIDILVVDALRRRYIDALAKFVHERCVKTEKVTFKGLAQSVKAANILDDFAGAAGSSTPAQPQKDFRQSEAFTALAKKADPRGPGQPFVYMRDFQRHFDMFCAMQKLNG